MIGLLQRVSEARVAVEGTTVASITVGLLVFVGIRPDDTEASAHRLLTRILRYRVFPDHKGRMNLGLQDAGGGLLLVPQFTLAADTRQGLRPGFSTAAPPNQARILFDHLLKQAQALYPGVQSGCFGMSMQVSLVNEGPVTLWLES